MAEIIRNRTIRPSTRKKSSIYKIDTSKLFEDDILVVNINHEKSGFTCTYKFRGINIYPKKSIHFKVEESNEEIKINWYSNLTPFN